MSSKDNTKDEKAQTRTDWAEDRTILANERTFSSWTGTGLGSLGMAVALQAVFGAVEPTWVAKTVASVFVLASIYIFLSALRNTKQARERMHASDVEPKSQKSLMVIAYSMCVGAIAVGIILWLA